MLGFTFTGTSTGTGPATGLHSGPHGGLARVHGAAEIRQSLLTLFSTRPGERRLLPGYGCDLDRLLFEPNDATTAGLAMRLIGAAVAQHEPRARIDRLDAGPDPDAPERLFVQLDFTDLRDGVTGTVAYSMALDG